MDAVGITNSGLQMKRIGYACKWLDHASEVAGIKANSTSRDLNGRSTTMRWLREHPAEAEQRQWDIMNHNTAARARGLDTIPALVPYDK